VQVYVAAAVLYPTIDHVVELAASRCNDSPCVAVFTVIFDFA
jgi:hypothetical protein